VLERLTYDVAASCEEHCCAHAVALADACGQDVLGSHSRGHKPNAYAQDGTRKEQNHKDKGEPIYLQALFSG
jgi:hypothetical protein